MQLALLVARLFIGLGLFAHGAQKLFGWYGGHGLDGTGGFFEQLGFRPGRTFALAAGLGEAVGGLLIALGLLGPLGPATAAIVMFVAAITVHVQKGFFSTNGGYELPVLYALSGLMLAFTGPGVYSLDHLLGLDWLTNDAYALLAVVGAAAATGLSLLIRHVQPAVQATPQL